MTGYKKILLALDLSEHNDVLCGKGAELSRLYDADISYIHVVEPVLLDMPYDVIPAESIELEQELVKNSHARLAEYSRKYNVPADNLLVETGSSKSEILRIADEQDIDLIIVGSHGRHGFSLLLGSTANAVIHGASCDVLAVRLK